MNAHREARRNLPLRFSLAAAFAVLGAGAPGADPVFSGPQPGESTTPFRVLELTGKEEGKERDPITGHAGAATALVFIHTLERSLVPLLRVVDQYGAERKERLKTEIVFLFHDRLEGEPRGRAAARSLQLQSRVGLSLDGAEGPGNYGLNKDCMMTIIAAQQNKVAANFALVQPGIADAPKVIEALARVCGDSTPPTVTELSERQAARSGGRERAGRMREGGGLEAGQPKENFPGAVPTDPKLNSLLRQFIRATNDDATVDKLLAELSHHIEGSPELTQQAIDGWTRILHFGDRYGTAYARKIALESLDRLKKEKPRSPKPN